jgi:hypothetical protein
MRLQVPFCELAPLTLRQEQILTREVHIACVPRKPQHQFPQPLSAASFHLFLLVQYELVYDAMLWQSRMCKHDTYAASFVLPS